MSQFQEFKKNPIFLHIMIDADCCFQDTEKRDFEKLCLVFVDNFDVLCPCVKVTRSRKNTGKTHFSHLFWQVLVAELIV